ncbi:MAG: response regulator [Thermoanaerobaculia bacterium]
MTVSSSHQPAILPVARQGRVLVVDDDASIREGMKLLLESVGLDVITHDSMITLPLVMRTFRPDVLVLDIDMPALSGVSFLRMSDRKAVTNSEASVILFSGIPVRHLADLAESFGAEFITKCEEPREIGERVRRAVEIRRVTQVC